MSQRGGAALVFAIALAFRALVSAPGLANPERSHGLDTGGYILLADNLWHGNGFSWDTLPPYQANIVRAPVYPLFLALARAPWHSDRPALVLQILLGAFLALLVFYLGETASGNGFLPGLLAALDPFTALFGAMLYSELLFSILIALGALLLFRKKTPAAGLILGFSCLVRPTGIALVVAGIYPALRRDWRGLGEFLACFAAVPVLWIVRNALVTRMALFPALSGVSDINLFVFTAPMTRAEAEGTSYQEAWQASDPVLRAQYESDPYRAANDPAFLVQARRQALGEIISRPLAYCSIYAKGLVRGLGGLDFSLPSRVLAEPPRTQGSLGAALRALVLGDLPGFRNALRERFSGTPPVALVYTIYSWLFMLALYFLVVKGTRVSPEHAACLLMAGALVFVAGPLASFRFRMPGHGPLEAVAGWSRPPSQGAIHHS